MAQGVDLDQFDLAILAIVQKDATTPQRVIGEAINLSAPAVQRRIKRMQEAGVIQANVAVVDPVKLGQTMTILVEIVMIFQPCSGARSQSCAAGRISADRRATLFAPPSATAPTRLRISRAKTFKVKAALPQPAWRVH